MTARGVFLLGRRDRPTDALEDYCSFLSTALARRGGKWELARVEWADLGWGEALVRLRSQAASWNGTWVLAQYTALGWSRRGLPLGFLRVLRALHRAGARIAVVFHDVEPWGGSRPVDRLRRAVQRSVMRRACSRAGRAIITIPLEKASWVPAGQSKASFVPVGANLPQPPLVERAFLPGAAKTIAVFGVTGPPFLAGEVAAIADIVRRADVPNAKLLVLGRNSDLAREPLRRGLEGSGVEWEVLGLLPAEQVAAALVRADVLLFLRGQITSQRGSALAGIACGLPVLGVGGPLTAAPITEAGVLLALDDAALADSLRRVLTDPALWTQLHRRSLAAQRAHFSWDAIAASLLGVLGEASL